MVRVVIIIVGCVVLKSWVFLFFYMQDVCDVSVIDYLNDIWLRECLFFKEVMFFKFFKSNVFWFFIVSQNILKIYNIYMLYWGKEIS